MATATLAPVRSFESLPAASQQAATEMRLLAHKRHRLEAVEELRLNGIIVSNAWEDGEPEPELMSKALNSKQMSDVVDFQSAADAQPMTIRDIRNVQPCGRKEITKAIIAIAERFVPTRENPSAYDQWERWGANWPEGDVRWTLTPHQLKQIPAKRR
jgi:hypothetical protein